MPLSKIYGLLETGPVTLINTSRKGVPYIMAQSWLDHVEIFSECKVRAHGHG